jgi:hypothetical protein
MIAGSQGPAKFHASRWKTVLLGLRLTNTWLGVRAITFFYGLWCLIGLMLCVVMVPFAVLGKLNTFQEALNPVALYGFVLPIGLMAATTWAVKLFSRFLWCAIPEPLTATVLAFASLAGRFSVLAAVVFLLLGGGPFRKGLLLPQTIVCAGVAWLGLIAEWGFVRTLRHFIPVTGPPVSSPESPDDGADTSEHPVPAQSSKGLLTRDLGAWFGTRFPRISKLAGWFLLPLGYVVLSSLAEKGDAQSIPDAILRFAVVAPAVIQVFWIPGENLAELIDALKAAPPDAGSDSP